ncbi:unnamed protein product [Urochloa humidicola]
MNKTSWLNVRLRFLAATGKNYDKGQFLYRKRLLHKIWVFTKKMCKKIGLGSRSDGGVLADDDWWKENAKGDKELESLRYKGLPSYINDLDGMCSGIAVDGSSAFVPGNDDAEESLNDNDDSPSGQHAAIAEDAPSSQHTPTSTSSRKRGSSTSTTASSPNSKKSKSPAVHAMNNLARANDRFQYMFNDTMQQQMNQYM